MPEKKEPKKLLDKDTLVKLTKFGIFGVIGLVTLLLLAFASYSMINSEKVYGRQYLGTTALIGKSKSEVEKLIKQNTDDYLNATLVLKNADADKTYPLDFAEIGLSFDNEKTLDSIWSYGRSGNVINDFCDQFLSIIFRRHVAASFTLNEVGLSKKVADIAAEIDQPEADYNLVYKDDKFTLASEKKDGKRVDQPLLSNTIKKNISALSKNEIGFSLNIYKPRVKEANANKTLEEANLILSKGTLLLVFEDKKFEVDINTIGSFIVSKIVSDDLQIAFDEDRLAKFIETIGKNINNEPINAKLNIVDGRAQVFQPSRQGRVLDQAATIDKIKKALLDRIKNPAATVTLEVEDKKPEVNEGEINKLGILELVGSGYTNFSGSPANRIHNITVGANSMNGVILAPGETFSTLAHLGAIDAAGGYLEELVIKDNSTVPEFGGGLCQVSTTLFRAALNAGMKIVERSAHKYRVGYFEPLVGMDATIYSPAPDFKFTNNYASHVLIQAKITGNKITFDFYGTKDGRKIEVGAPRAYDFTDPEPPINVETDTLPPGEKKQLEKAHKGATAAFDYKVTAANGEVLQQKTFVSKYVPWPERWLIGKQPTPTETTPAPAPEPQSSSSSSEAPPA